MDLVCTIQILLFIFFNVGADNNLKRCGRQKSRVVRNVIETKVVIPFQLLNAELPETCPFNPYKDIYKIQEDNKIRESSSKWTCRYCGKGFISEDFIDKHFDNRHSSELTYGQHTVCLADFCDIFRCDIISGIQKPDFWDFALCMEDDITEASDECYKIMETCVPKHLTANETKHVKGILQDAVCSYLTCSKYWEIPKTEVPDGKIALYVVTTLLIAFGLLVYYCVFYQFYYTDTFTDSIVYDPSPRGRHHLIPYREIRHRIKCRPDPS